MYWHIQVEEDKKRRESRQQVKQQQPKGEKEKDGVVTPEYTLVNRYGVDMADYSQSLTGTPLVSISSLLGGGPGSAPGDQRNLGQHLGDLGQHLGDQRDLGQHLGPDMHTDSVTP